MAIYAGLYNIAADVPHTQPVYWLFDTIRQRSVIARARDIAVPDDLDDASRILKGASEYAEMCNGCHLAPGMKRTEMSQGLYPARRSFGMEATLPCRAVLDHQAWGENDGMPAWSITHDDELLWDVVAFVRKLPEMTPEQYETLVKNAPKHEELMQDMEMGGDDNHTGKNGHE